MQKHQGILAVEIVPLVHNESQHFHVGVEELLKLTNGLRRHC